MGVLNGRELRKVFEAVCPFNEKMELKPEEERKTILASNANIPLEVEARGFVMAAAQGKQSPMIIQLSYNSNNITGSASDSVKPIEGVERSNTNPAVEGAKRASDMVKWFVEDYNAKLVAISLDHFNVPKFDFQKHLQTPADPLQKRIAEARINDVIEFLHEYGKDAFPDLDKEVSKEIKEAYANYMGSSEYLKFKLDFLGTVQAISPAWGMIDTEKIPKILDFVITRDISDGVREVIGNDDMIIEAEFGATGVSGKEEEYEKLTGLELERFARQVVLFTRYSGAEGIAYPIGMAHAAKKGEKHEPDVEKLTLVQKTLFKEMGQYIPFAQHGGTGAARVIKGLVGKNNINTNYLVVEANFLYEWMQKYGEGVRGGDKKVCGTSIYTGMVAPVTQAAIEKLKECGTYQIGPEIIEYLRKSSDMTRQKEIILEKADE